jgi:hypothetical protein
MRNRRLHDSLRSFALEASKLLRDDQLAGAELEFDLDEGHARGGPTLYHYRPLTSRFIDARWTRLRMLETRLPASEALGAGSAAYLRVNGLRGGEDESALQAMLEALYEDMTDFSFPEERFERVYGEVERTLYERSRPATILVPVHGVELAGTEVELGGGITLTRGDRTDAPDEAVWGDPAERAADEVRETAVLLVLTRDVTPDDRPPLPEARERFAALLTAMRLYRPGGVALSALAWRRTGDGGWQPFELESSGIASGEPWVLAEDEHEDLREFLAAIGDRRTATGATAWALRRFELGCGRGRESEALSDHLLGLRALLDGGERGARASLASRVAVLCAAEGERKRVQRRVELAQALERLVMGDEGPDDAASDWTLVAEVERHLRALLRDVLCGYLDADLRRVADDLLIAPPEPFQIHARSLREGPATAVARGEAESVRAPAASGAADTSITTEIEALEQEAPEQGVTAVELAPEATDEQDSLDDPAFWSAPV